MRSKIVAAARACLGTPFRHQGRLVGVGMDCAGVLIHVLNTLGLPHDDEKGYPRHPYAGMLETILNRQPSLTEISRSAARHGDVLLMRFRREPQHIAIHAGATMIHSYSGIGRVIEHTLDDLWKRRITAAYRITGIEDVE